MESPVMTSASSHRLRSAVSACAQPTHSYLNSSYLGTSIQVESHNSGGCLKKFYNSGKNGESSPSSLTRKSHSGNDYSPLHKRHKTSCRNGGFHHQQHHRAKADGKEVEAASDGGVLHLIPKQFVLGSDFLSKLSLNRHFLDSGRFADYREKRARNETGAGGCGEKVINGEKSSVKSRSDDSGNGEKVLVNHQRDGCAKAKSKNRATAGKKDSADGENQPSDECSNCGVGYSDRSSQRNAISGWHPEHAVKRKTTQIDRWLSLCGESKIEEDRDIRNDRLGSAESVRLDYVKLFKDLQLLPSAPEASEMLECAKESPGKPQPVNYYSPAVVKDFCRGRPNEIIKAEKAYKTSRAPARIQEENEEKRSRKFSKGMSKYEVFLGGSCNPTTWRTDFAIPELEKMGITYYNPQVEEWRPELMEAEHHAKENAAVMFFVLDNQTRGVSALIEVAHLAGNHRKLILVVQSFTQKNQVICEETISEREYEDLKAGQEVLQDLVERQGIPVFSDIKTALERTEEILRRNLTVQDLQPAVRPNRENPIEPRDVFEKLDAESSGEISAADSCFALKMLTGADVSESELKTFISKAGNDLNGTPVKNVKLDLERFSELFFDFQRRLRGGEISIPSRGPISHCRDVYLGGTIENTSWRESIAVPMLEEENLSYFVPKISEGGRRFTEVEAAAMEHSFVLFFAITNAARSIAAMAIAGHYIRKNANVVLCVEYLAENATIGEEKLTENAVKDYNRGRMYLKDIAERCGVPVFTDISTAVKFVTEKCRNR